ncbi:MAG: hypothetical protein JWP27_572 [Flaviaesturariibacter sp.]|nr:hypothetical protein [Flaviaesturariibacter sp.]
MYIESHIKTAELVLENYTGKMPFAPWLRDFFRQDKKYGSRDRRTISHLCYSFFRLGNAFAFLSLRERIRLAQFLTADAPSPVLEAIDPAWNEQASLPAEDKLALLEATAEGNAMFPWTAHISPEIQARSFALAHLVQPGLFLRVRPGRDAPVRQALTDAGLDFSEPIPHAIALDNGTKADQLIDLDIDAVVQDLSSQQVLSQLVEAMPPTDRPFDAWDCCAASGGKSILLHDTYPRVRLSVTDVRKSILLNLRVRFERAGIKSYTSTVADLASPDFRETSAFDLVLCDAPCSGSGTWGRTPEQLRLFREQEIDRYAALQETIAVRAARQVRPGGFFLYVTCSVFEKENEAIVATLQKKTALRLKAMRYYKGYDRKADTLFAALFTL